MNGIYPLVNVYIANWKMTIELVDFPMNSIVISQFAMLVYQKIRGNQGFDHEIYGVSCKISLNQFNGRGWKDMSKRMICGCAQKWCIHASDYAISSVENYKEPLDSGDRVSMIEEYLEWLSRSFLVLKDVRQLCHVASFCTIV